MAEPYRDFPELVLHCVQGRDYRFNIHDLGDDVTITAIHGGAIEPMTSEVAMVIAGEDHNLYDLRGMRAGDNSALRVPAQRFDEMRLRTLLKRSRTALSVLGVPGEEPVVHLGGKNRRLRAVLEEQLVEAGFAVRGPHGPGAAHHPRRFVNWPSAGGVQMELSLALRRTMTRAPLEGFQWEDPAGWTDRFNALVRATRGALRDEAALARDDLGEALERFEAATRTFPAELRSSYHHHGAHGGENGDGRDDGHHHVRSNGHGTGDEH